MELMADRCLQDEPGLKSKDSGLSSLDGESNSDNEDQSQGDPNGLPGKRRMRKIPKLPMVRHGKKWYRARLLKDSGQRVQIGTARRLLQALSSDEPALCCTGTSPAALVPHCLIEPHGAEMFQGASCPPVPTSAASLLCMIRLPPIQRVSNELHSGLTAHVCLLSACRYSRLSHIRTCAHAEFTGFEEVNGTVSLPRESDRIWRGSYKGKDWRYLVSFTPLHLLCYIIWCGVLLSRAKR